jgi:mannose/fructose/N-acetylgalactosamine-specific phosphotransferase system component IIB
MVFSFLFFKNKIKLLHTMHERRHKILVALVFTMAMHRVIAQVVALEQITIGQHWSMMSAICCFP